MKRTVVLVVIALVIIGCKPTTESCSDFKTGTFIQNLEEFDALIYSSRTEDGFQPDSSRFGVSRYKLKWNTDCNFESTLIETTIESSKKYIGRKYYVDVMKVLSNKEYIYNCRVDGIDFQDQDTIMKTD
jgi:hypothetical protein